MMNKQKQIEEMANILSDDYCDIFDDGQGQDCCMHCDDCRASRLYEAGYRKITEGSVVLTREEYQSTTYWRERAKMWKQCTYDIRKETAEKFAERLKKDCTWRNDFDNEGVAHPYTILELEELDEICKEITEGKDE